MSNSGPLLVPQIVQTLNFSLKNLLLGLRFPSVAGDGLLLTTNVHPVFDDPPPYLVEITIALL